MASTLNYHMTVNIYHDFKVKFRTQINSLSAEECSELQKVEERGALDGTKTCGEGMWIKDKNGEYQFDWLIRVFEKFGEKGDFKLVHFCTLRWFSNYYAQYWIIENFCSIDGSYYSLEDSDSIRTINLIVNWLKNAEFPVFLWVNIDSTIDERFDWNVFENVRCGDNCEKYFCVVSKEQMSYFSHLNVEDQNEKLVSYIFSYDDDAFIRENQTEMPLLTELEEENIENLRLPYMRGSVEELEKENKSLRIVIIKLKEELAKSNHCK
jgi:hypothetical protein